LTVVRLCVTHGSLVRSHVELGGVVPVGSCQRRAFDDVARDGRG
jgi:hypothetical protein